MRRLFPSLTITDSEAEVGADAERKAA